MTNAQPTGRGPTITAVAERAGVSAQTVSNALNAPDRLRPATLTAVLRAVDELGYRPHHAARSLRTHTAHAIGCRLQAPGERMSGGVFERFLFALSDAARAARYGVLCHAAGDDEDELAVFDTLRRQGSVDGFVVTATHADDPRPTWLARHRVPFVCFGRPWGEPDAGHSWVDVDGSSGVQTATEHLIAQGHRRIAWLGWRADPGLGGDRRSGWLRAMRAAALPVRGLRTRCHDTLDGGEAAASALLGRPDAPTALVCVSDQIALGALRAVQDARLRPGADVGVVGFDDSAGSRLVRPGLTTLHQPLERAAAETMRLLLARVRDPGAAAQQVLLAPDLVVRGSSLRA